MNEKLFRKSSLDKIKAPEQLSDYIRVSNPGVWMTFAAIIVLLGGICVWGVFGHMDTKLTVPVVVTQGRNVCYVKEANISLIKEGMTVTCGDKTYQIAKIAETPTAVDGSFQEYTIHVGNLQTGEWVYEVSLNGSAEDGTYQGKIVIDSVSPMSFVFN